MAHILAAGCLGEQMDYRKADLEARLAIAQAQDTSLEILQQLATDEVEAVQRAIALNPNADEALLRSLGKAFPEEVIQNPVFGLLLLENPKSDFVLLSQARSVSASAELLERCAQSNEEEMLIAVGGNPEAPLHVLEQLVNEPPVLSGVEYTEREDYQYIFTAIVENPATSPQLLQKIVEQWGVAECTVARNPKTPVELLKKFSTWRNREMLLAVAQNPAAPTAIIESLAIEEYEAVRDAARSHPNAPSNIEELTNFVEEQPGTSPELLGRLASDKREHIRYLVAKHPKTPVSVLEILAQDDNPKVVEKARYNPSASETVLINYAKFLVKQEKIASLSNKRMCEREADSLTRHPIVTEKTLKLLVSLNSSSTNEVMAKFREALSEAMPRLPYPTSGIHYSGDIVRNLETTSEELRELFERFSKSNSSNSIYYIADLTAHPNFPSDLWPKVLNRAEVLASAASNPNLPIDAFFTLAQIEDRQVLIEIAQNPNTPSKILEKLMSEDIDIRCKLVQNPSISTSLLKVLASDDDALVQQEVTKHVKTNEDMLDKLSKSEDRATVFSIACNANASLEALIQVVDRALVPIKKIDYIASSIRQRRKYELLKQKRLECLQKLANHPRADEAILKRLISQNDFRVHCCVLERPDLDGGTIQLIVDKAIAKMLSKEKGDFCQPALARACKHPNTPDSILESFAHDQPRALKDAFGEPLFLFLREGVAQNPNTPLAVLEHLREDRQGQVKEAAIQTILMRN